MGSSSRSRWSVRVREGLFKYESRSRAWGRGRVRFLRGRSVLCFTIAKLVPGSRRVYLDSVIKYSIFELWVILSHFELGSSDLSDFGEEFYYTNWGKYFRLGFDYFTWFHFLFCHSSDDSKREIGGSCQNNSKVNNWVLNIDSELELDEISIVGLVFEWVVRICKFCWVPRYSPRLTLSIWLNIWPLSFGFDS